MNAKLLGIGALILTAAAYITAILIADVAAVWLIPMAVVVLGWVVAIVQNWRSLSAVMLVLAFATNGTGAILEVQPMLLVTSSIMALITWQIALFDWRLTHIDDVRHPDILMGRLLQRIGVFALISLIFTGSGATLQLDIGFVPGAILTLILLYALSRVVQRLTKEEAPS